MKELIEKLQEAVKNIDYCAAISVDGEYWNVYLNKAELKAILEALQSKGKTKEEVLQIQTMLSQHVTDATECGNNLDEKSWGMQSGILLSINEVNQILDLLEEYAQSANKDGWVSCAERFPELHSLGMSEDVLTIAGTKMRVKSYDHELKRWNGSPHITVTHWQPLPPKPQI